MFLPIEEQCGEEIIEQKQTKKQKKSMKQKKYCHDLSMFAGVWASRISPTVFVGLDRKGERDEQWLD